MLLSSTILYYTETKITPENPNASKDRELVINFDMDSEFFENHPPWNDQFLSSMYASNGNNSIYALSYSMKSTTGNITFWNHTINLDGKGTILLLKNADKTESINITSSKTVDLIDIELIGDISYVLMTYCPSFNSATLIGVICDFKIGSNIYSLNGTGSILVGLDSDTNIISERIFSHKYQDGSSHLIKSLFLSKRTDELVIATVDPGIEYNDCISTTNDMTIQWLDSSLVTSEIWLTDTLTTIQDSNSGFIVASTDDESANIVDCDGGEIIIENRVAMISSFFEVQKESSLFSIEFTSGLFFLTDNGFIFSGEVNCDNSIATFVYLDNSMDYYCEESLPNGVGDSIFIENNLVYIWDNQGSIFQLGLDDGINISQIAITNIGRNICHKIIVEEKIICSGIIESELGLHTFSISNISNRSTNLSHQLANSPLIENQVEVIGDSNSIKWDVHHFDSNNLFFGREVQTNVIIEYWLVESSDGNLLSSGRFTRISTSLTNIDYHLESNLDVLIVISGCINFAEELCDFVDSYNNTFNPNNGTFILKYNSGKLISSNLISGISAPIFSGSVLIDSNHLALFSHYTSCGILSVVLFDLEGNLINWFSIDHDVNIVKQNGLVGFESRHGNTMVSNCFSNETSNYSTQEGFNQLSNYTSLTHM